MNNEVKANNLFLALLFLVLGILIVNYGIVSIISKVMGAILMLIGLIKSVKYIYLKGKLGKYDLRELIIGIIVICLGLIFIMFSSTFDFAVNVTIGIFALFSGINKLIIAISLKNEDKVGFRTFLSSALIMILIGITLTTGLFNDFLGWLVIVYSVCEIVDYIYSRCSERKNSKSSKSITKQKKLKNSKVVDAVIEEGK